jgi:hypothetical protein
MVLLVMLHKERIIICIKTLIILLLLHIIDILVILDKFLICRLLVLENKIENLKKI